MRALVTRESSTEKTRRLAASSVLCVGFEGLELSAELQEHLDAGVRSVILFGRNVSSPEQVARLCRAIKQYAQKPILICTDQEGGAVRRLRQGFSDVPPMRDVGGWADADAARRIGLLLGTELRAVGVDMNLAPVLDVDTNPDNPVIGSRSFSSEPAVVADLGVALAQGLEQANVASCAKHFPGHGDTELDSHLALPRVRRSREELERIELLPFRAYCEARLSAVMTAHVAYDALDPGVPATLSHPILTGLLRQQWGYDGLIVTDDLNMKAVAGKGTTAVGSIAAGADLLLVCRHAEKVKRAREELISQCGSGDFLSRLRSARDRVEAFVARWAAPAIEYADLGLLGRGAGTSPLASGRDPTEDGNW